MPEENTRPRLSLRLILFVILPILLISALLFLTFLNYFLGTGINQKSDISVNKASEINPNKVFNNPFDKDTQYINPFSEYRNPFDQ